jgi:hypothetical protein
MRALIWGNSNEANSTKKQIVSLKNALYLIRRKTRVKKEFLKSVQSGKNGRNLENNSI